MLERLPPELFASVLDLLNDRSDLKKLCQVSKVINAQTQPALYRSITIWSKNEDQLEEINVRPWLHLAPQSRENFIRYTKSVTVASLIHEKLKKRCPHYDIPRSEWTQEDGPTADLDQPQTLISERLMPLLELLPEGQLRSFCWRLGACVPQRILGSEGYLLQKQKNIEELGLITGSSCDQSWEGWIHHDISQFKRLRKLAWIGPRWLSNFESLGRALVTNMTRLTHLELNLLSVTQVDQSWAFSQVDQDGQLCANFFVNYLRGLSNKGIDFKLSALKMLSLSHMPFNNAEEDMAAAFNFGGLKSLTLRQCSGVEELLDFLVESEQEIQFTSLELQCGSIDPMFEEQNTSVIDFLEQFSGLEEFYLGESNIMDTESLWRALGGHIPTLKRFVHHRCYVVDTGEHVPGLIKYQDTMEMGTDDNIFNSKDPHPREILAELDLTNLGVCCSPLHLKDLLEPFRSKNTLRLLHIRRAGKVLKRKRRNRVWRDSYKSTFWDPYQREARKLDPRDRLSRAPGALLDFAQWAFGPDGLPSLVVLAFGDFSYGGRFARWNQLLCRDPGPIERHQQWTFRSMFKGNCRQECWNVLKSNERFLQACPSERIIENDHDPDSDEEWEEWSQADFIGSP